MKIKDIGGEFELLKRVTKPITHQPHIICGIGDDCAIIESQPGTYLLVTTDMMVQDDHFHLDWFTPAQVGKKLMESNVSDVISMGGAPEYAFLSMSLTKETEVEFLEDFYRGLYESAERHTVLLLGGDTTHGTEYVFNITLTGKVPAKGCRLRSMACPGDMICVTGTLGGSTAGLKLLLKKKEGYLMDHLEPRSRTTGEGNLIARYAHAMIDVSDGLGSEVTHICERSHTGAEIFRDRIPISEKTRQSADILGEDPYDFALYGGEDFELVFTIPGESISKLEKEFSDFTIVGRILEQKAGIHIIHNGKKEPVLKGYDHFA
jgi:thiamine-monophosphate kinase